MLFRHLDVDVYFLEFDDSRSGSFEPLRFLPALSSSSSPTVTSSGNRRRTPKDKVVVLGLISSKIPTLEDEEKIKERIEQAAKVVDGGKQRLGLSAQCGFSSTSHGNDVRSGRKDERGKKRKS